VNRQEFLKELMRNSNIDIEGHTGPLLEEKRGLEHKLQELRDRIDTYIELLG
jgi:hypothetical protein